MIRAVLFAVALFVMTTVMPFEVVRAEVKKIETKSCHWAYEVYKTKIGENCQKDLLGKLSSEQDKIFAQRIFKNWQPLTGYEVETNDRGLIRIMSTKEDDFLEIQWISIEPAIAIINGVVVTDEVKDESVYRRLERMLKKADDAKVAMGFPSRRHPFQSLFSIEEAEAAGSSNVDDAAFMFMVDMNTDPAKGPSYTVGSAEDLVTNDKVDFHNSHHISSKGNWLTRNLKLWKLNLYKETVQCQASGDGKGRMTIVSVKEKIGDKDVTIESVAGSRTQFMVTGYPKAGDHVLVDFAKGTGARDKYMVKGKLISKGRTWTDKRGKKHRVKARYGKPSYASPCTGLYRADFNDGCGKLWMDLAEDEKFPEVKEAIEKFADPEKIRWGKDISCDEIYPDKKEAGNLYRGNLAVTMRHECEEHFDTKFQKENRIFSEDKNQAHLSYCSSAVVSSCTDKQSNSKKKLQDSDFDGEGPAAPENVRAVEIGGMQQYVEAWNNDPSTTHYKSPSDICPSLGLSADAQAAKSDLAKDCLKPPKDAGAKLKNFHKALSAGNVSLYGKVRGGQIRRDLEQKVLSAMILGECCNSQTCARAIEDKSGIKLEGAKSIK